MHFQVYDYNDTMVTHRCVAQQTNHPTLMFSYVWVGLNSHSKITMACDVAPYYTVTALAPTL